MAKIEFPGIDEYAKLLAELGTKAEGVCKYAIYDAAGLVVDSIKSNTPERTGDLKNSTSLIDFQNKDGFIYTKVDWPGYDRKGVANRIKARVLESGSSTRQKHPFIRQAVNAVKTRALSLIEFNLDKKINELMNNK